MADMATASLFDVVRIEPIRRHLTPHLTAVDLLNFCLVSRDFHGALYDAPSTWQTIDLSTAAYKAIAPLIARDAASRGVRQLSLDCADITFAQLDTIVDRLSRLRQLSIVGLTAYSPSRSGTGSDSDKIGSALVAFLASLHTRLPELRFVALLGAPLFTTSGENRLAYAAVQALSHGGPRAIGCDLWPCAQRHPFQREDASVWYLCGAQANSCEACGATEFNCYTCTNARQCRGCLKFWCHGCAHTITRVCYECGYSCARCKQGIIATCTECSSRFCRLHSRDTTSRYARPAPASSASTVHPLDADVGHLAIDAARAISTIGRGRTTGLENLAERASGEDLDNCCDWCIQGTHQGWGH